MPEQALLAFRHNVFSQRGEDGIIEQIFRVLPPCPVGVRPACVEFGASDGIANSNTRHLIANNGWASVQIEADPDKFAKLADLYDDSRNVACRQRTVGWGESDSLDAILRGTDMRSQFDLLSIDVDGNDWYCWAACKAYRPRVVIVEFNPTFPPWVEWVQPADPDVNHGCSLGALCALGKAKGYELVCATEWNAIFVLRELFPLFCIPDNRPERLACNQRLLTWVAQGYDGTLIPGGKPELMWKNSIINFTAWQEQIQVLPAPERTYNWRLKKEQPTA